VSAIDNHDVSVPLVWWPCSLAYLVAMEKLPRHETRRDAGVVETMRRRRAYHWFAPARRKSPRRRKRKRRSQASPNKLDHSEPRSHARIALPSPSPVAWLVQRERSSRIAFVVATAVDSAQRKEKKKTSSSERRMRSFLSRMQLAMIARVGLSEHASDSACW
jgi:hypothetical protein